MSSPRLLLAAAFAVACAPDLPREPADAPSSARADAGPVALEGTLQLAQEPSGKRFTGFWLLRDDGERWVLATSPTPWLQPFAELRVRVTGERYEPAGQALSSPHLHVHSVRLVDPEQARAPTWLVAVGAEQTLSGRFVERVGEPGTKLAGEAYRVFAADDGVSWLLAHAPDGASDARVTITARPVEASPYVARRGGPTLWVLAVTAKEAAPAER